MPKQEKFLLRDLTCSFVISTPSLRAHVVRENEQRINATGAIAKFAEGIVAEDHGIWYLDQSH